MQTATRITRQWNLLHPFPISTHSRRLIRTSLLLNNSNANANANSNPNQPPPPPLTGSAKLFADAAVEDEVEALPSRPPRAPFSAHAPSDSKNWDGDEDIRDTVLRMLVDKYKPLRSGVVRSAEEKIREVGAAGLGGVRGEWMPWEPASGSTSVGESASATTSPNSETASTTTVTNATGGGGTADVNASTPLIPSIPGHRPWHTQFKVPDHARVNVKLGSIPTRLYGDTQQDASSANANANAGERKAKRAASGGGVEQATRLTKAREGMLDYKMGLRPGAREGANAGRVNPTPNPRTVKGWAGLVEDRIEKARQSGSFNTLKGRGQPLIVSDAERNPFIGREEFLMNRIVLRNGAAPAWVELQKELETATSTFRRTLLTSYTQHAIRYLTTTYAPSYLASLTPTSISYVLSPTSRSHVTREWAAKERGYHEKLVKELNEVVRRYNALAPYSARRGVVLLDAEIGRVWKDSEERIWEALRERIGEKEGRGNTREGVQGVGTGGAGGGEGGEWVGLGTWVLGFVRRVLARMRMRLVFWTRTRRGVTT